MRLKTAFLAVAAASLAACAAQKPVVKSSSQSAANPPAPAVNPTETGEAVTRDDVLHAIPELKTVYFPYDSAELSQEARATLRANAQWLKSNPSVTIQIAGNCDQRGTVEYNLALGQRRAAAVRHYLKMLGVRGKRMATISYGKEKLVCQDDNEACWSRNRRAETLGALPAELSKK